MKIAIVGYGKMGKAIEKIALDRGHEIVLKSSSSNPLKVEQLKNIDVAIEFTVPSTVIGNLNLLIENNIPTIVGTTGWNKELNSITEKVEQNKGALVHASNFSIGVNIFFKLNQYLAKLMNGKEEYTPSITEIHHLQKLDAPSGTAITLAEGIINENNSINTHYCPENKEQKTSNSIKIDALREPEVPGTHIIDYSSEIDTITIKHEAHKRTGFALGAVVAAEWITNKKGVFTMQDVLQF